MWTCSAPSNIALIKYMGKCEGNMPCNVSLSYTLEKFRTEVSLTICNNEDIFENEEGLSQESVDRFMAHLNYIKKLTKCSIFFRVKSKNNFPHSAGIASSASSFAALTKCAFQAISDVQNFSLPTVEKMSEISRKASGSSCRSFFAPWCIWEKKHAKKADIKLELLHDLVLIDGKIKEVPSSEAHRRVKSSLLFKGRARRADERLEKLLNALNNDEWSNAYQICWEEFMDMHALFETATPHFGYILPKTVLVLQEIKNFWKNNNDGPIVTMDAGANVHLLWRKDQVVLRKTMFEVIPEPFL